MIPALVFGTAAGLAFYPLRLAAQAFLDWRAERRHEAMMRTVAVREPCRCELCRAVMPETARACRICRCDVGATWEAA